MDELATITQMQTREYAIDRLCEYFAPNKPVYTVLVHCRCSPNGSVSRTVSFHAAVGGGLVVAYVHH